MCTCFDDFSGRSTMECDISPRSPYDLSAKFNCSSSEAGSLLSDLEQSSEARDILGTGDAKESSGSRDLTLLASSNGHISDGAGSRASEGSGSINNNNNKHNKPPSSDKKKKSSNWYNVSTAMDYKP